VLNKIFYDENELPNVKVYETAQKVVFDFMNKQCKSIDFVASELGTTAGYLYPILNPKRIDKPLSMDRVIAITKLTKDNRIIEAINSEFNLISVSKDRFEKVSNISLQEMLIQVNIECADVFKKGMEAIADGKVTRQEQKKLLIEIEEEQQKMEELKQALLNCELVEE
jgi:hypothetical protein